MGNIMPVTAGIIRDEAERVLLTQRGEAGSNPLEWEFPGGKLRNDESPEECLRRELREELGIRVEVGDIFHVVHHRYPGGSILLLAYHCRWKSDRIFLTEHKAYDWVEPSRLLSFSLAEADRPIARKLRRERG